MAQKSGVPLRKHALTNGTKPISKKYIPSFLKELGSKSARFARALTFLAPAECFYGNCTLSVTTIQIQHEIRVGSSPDRPKAKPG